MGGIIMYPFVKPAYNALSVDQKKELCSLSYRISTALKPWTPNSKTTVLELIEKVKAVCPYTANDLNYAVKDIEQNNPLLEVPATILDFLKAYCNQFFRVVERNLCLPIVESNVVAKPVVEEQPEPETQHYNISIKPTGRLRAITEEVWWVIRVKSEYRMCRLTFERGEYWEMIEYQAGKVLNPQYRFPKYDNRIIYEFKEHLTPDMFNEKIKEAVRVRKEALLAQANKMLKEFETVLIARHLTGGTLVGGVLKEDDTNWYLDTYNEQGEHIFYGDTVWELPKKSRCSVVQIIKRE
jgi:hypothetical protein